MRSLIATTFQSPTKIISELKKAQQNTIGFDVQTSSPQDLVKIGVLDPLKSIRLAVALASAHAKAILQTGAWELDNAAKGDGE